MRELMNEQLARGVEPIVCSADSGVVHRIVETVAQIHQNRAARTRHGKRPIPKPHEVGLQDAVVGHLPPKDTVCEGSLRPAQVVLLDKCGSDSRADKERRDADPRSKNLPTTATQARTWD
jgi:hypothetical protein